MSGDNRVGELLAVKHAKRMGQLSDEQYSQSMISGLGNFSKPDAYPIDTSEGPLNVRKNAARKIMKSKAVNDAVKSQLGVDPANVMDAISAGDVNELFATVVTNPQVMKKIWLTVPETFGLTIVVLDAILYYDRFFGGRKLPLWHCMAILLASAVFYGIILCFLLVVYLLITNSLPYKIYEVVEKVAA